MSQNLFWPLFLNRIIYKNFIAKKEMYSCFSTLSQILFKNSFGNVFYFSNFGHMTSFAQRQFVFGRRFETKHFLVVLFTDICFFFFWCIHKYRTEILTEKYSKMNGSKRIPSPCAQTGVKSSLCT